MYDIVKGFSILFVGVIGFQYISQDGKIIDFIVVQLPKWITGKK